MFGTAKEYISVSLTEKTLKVAHVKGAGAEQKIINVIRSDVAETSEEEIVKNIQSAMSTFVVKKAGAVCVISSSMTTTKNIEIPSIETEEIKSIIDLQAGRHTPYAREEILIGYIKTGVHSRNYTKILLIIANREQITKQLNMFDQAGLKIEKVLFAPEGKARFYQKILKPKEDDPPIGIIDIGKHATEFNVAGSSTVIACRNIPSGMENLAQQGQEAKDKLIGEFVQSLEAYQSEDIDKLPQRYLLTSSDEKIKELQPILQEKLKANVEVLPCIEHVKVDEPVMQKFSSEYADESFLDVIAPFNVMGDIEVDLIPEEIKNQRAIEEQGRQVIQSGAFAVILLALIIAIFFCKIHFRNQYLTKLTYEYAMKRGAVEELEDIATNTRIVKDYVHSRMVSLAVLDELYSKIPKEIYLKSIVLEENGSINIQGVSETRSTAFAFITILENSDLFKNAKMISSSAKKEQGKSVSVFEIAFKLESALEEEEVEEEVPAEEPEQPAEEE